MALATPPDHFSIEETGQSEQHCNLKSHSGPLPPFDEGLGTRKLLKIGFIISCIWAAIVMLWGLAMMVMTAMGLLTIGIVGEIPANGFQYGAKVCTLFFLATTTICCEILGYIHTTSLRWALANEGKLVYNSNLRLFTTSRVSRTNGLWANCLWIFSLILCHGGAVNAVSDEEITKRCTVGSVRPTLSETCVASTGSLLVTHMPSTLIMGLGLISLCVVTGIGWRAGERSGRIKSWNPHPLNTALVCLHHGFLERTITDPLSHDTGVGRPPILKLRACSSQKLIPSLRHITRYLFSMALITLTFALITLIVTLVQKWSYLANVSWAFFPVSGDSSPVTSQLTFSDKSGSSPQARAWISVLWASFWQVFPLLTFHIAELVVNLRRDETCWRSISKPEGAKFEENALLAAFSNKGSIGLFILKPLGNWIFSLGVFTIGFNPLPLLVLSVLILMDSWVGYRL